MTLPVPRDREERAKMLAAWDDGWRCGRMGFNLRASEEDREASIPPVGEPMPELTKPWALLNENGAIASMFDSRDWAEWYGQHHHRGMRVVRLAVVEVIDAPDSWERLAKDAFNQEVDHESFQRRAALLAGRGE